MPSTFASRLLNDPHALLLATAFCLGILLRLNDLNTTLNHDEVYTYQVFASKPYAEILSTYSVPNNHLLHTLLVRLTTQCFGSSEWSIRLPALLAGLLALPVIYTLGRNLFAAPRIALAATWLLALAPPHIHYSHTARGYSLLFLCSLLSLLWLWRALHGCGLWLLAFVLVCSLGAYVLPSGGIYMLALGFWATILCLQRRDWPRMGWTLVCSVVMALLVGIVYWPLRHEVALATDWGIAIDGSPFAALIALYDAVLFCVGDYVGTVVALLALAGFALLWRDRRELALYIGLVFLVPYASALALGTAGPPRSYVFLLAPIVLSAAYTVRISMQWLMSFALAAYLWVGVAACFRPVNEELRTMGSMLARESRVGDIVISPAILDRQVIYYAGGAVERGLVSVAEGNSLRRLLFITRATDPRFTFANFLLAPNFSAPAAGIAFPVGAMEKLAMEGAMALHSLSNVSQPLCSNGFADWRLFFIDREGPVQARPSLPFQGQPTLHIENPSGIRCVLQSPERFTVPRDGVAVLIYARTEVAGTVASLYRAVPGSTETVPMPMSRVSTDLIRIRDGEGRLWYLLAHIRPVQAGEQYGVYLMTWDVRQQRIGAFSAHFIPY